MHATTLYAYSCLRELKSCGTTILMSITSSADRASHGSISDLAPGSLRTLRAAADDLGIARSTLRIWIARGRVGVVRLSGRTLRVPATEVARLIHENFTPPASRGDAARA